MKRILVFTPCNRLEPETLAAIFALHYTGPIDHFFTRDNPYKKDIAQNIIYNYRKAQRVFLGGGYDALLTLENDIICPPDALDKLLAVDADIAYAVYAFRRGLPTLNITHAGDGNTYSAHKVEFSAAAGGVIDVGGIGFGCTLVHRHVLEAHALHSESGGSGDLELAREARESGLRQRADTSILCGHKKPNGAILWPNADGSIREEYTAAPLMTMVRPLMPFSGWNEQDKLYTVRPGDAPVRVNLEMAESLISADMAELV